MYYCQNCGADYRHLEVTASGTRVYGFNADGSNTEGCFSSDGCYYSVDCDACSGSCDDVVLRIEDVKNLECHECRIELTPELCKYDAEGYPVCKDGCPGEDEDSSDLTQCPACSSKKVEYFKATNRGVCKECSTIFDVDTKTIIF